MPKSEITKPISVIIVNYNGGKLLTESVRAVLASSIPVQVVISDNASMDNSIMELREAITEEPRLSILENDSNLGFSKANNLALPSAKGDFLLFLNPDCLVKPDTLEIMLAAMKDNPKAGIAGCLVRNADGSVQIGTIKMLPTPWRSMVRVLHLDKFFSNYGGFQSFMPGLNNLPVEPIETEGISGAFMFVRREALELTGPLDEGYFLHCEDLDWFFRFREAGWKILFVPGAQVIHHKGFCSVNHPYRVLWHKHKGMVRYYRKFFSTRYSLPLTWLVIATVWARFSLLAIREIFTRKGG